MARFILGERPFLPDEAAQRVLASVSHGMLAELTSRLQNATWSASGLEAAVRDFAEAESVGLGKVAQPLRVALTGRTISPGVFDMMEILGREESLARLDDCMKTAPTAI
jgi:glutamyl-tRNA synthetase